MKGVCKLENGITVSQNTNTLRSSTRQAEIYQCESLYEARKQTGGKSDFDAQIHKLMRFYELTLQFANCAFILKAQNRIIIKWLLKGQGPVWMLVNEQFVILKHFN